MDGLMDGWMDGWMEIEERNQSGISRRLMMKEYLWNPITWKCLLSFHRNYGENNSILNKHFNSMSIKLLSLCVRILRKNIYKIIIFQFTHQNQEYDTLRLPLSSLYADTRPSEIHHVYLWLVNNLSDSISFMKILRMFLFYKIVDRN